MSKQSALQNLFRNLKCVLIDLNGTLHIGNNAIEGAVDSLQRLRSRGLKIRFVTNTTKESRRCLYQKLTNLGFAVTEDEMYTSLIAARNLVEKRKLKPFLILDKNAVEDFEGINCENPNAVVIGLAKDELNYENMNTAFRLVLDGAELIATHKGRYYRDDENLSLGPGPFVRGLEYATDKEAIVIGKPVPIFFTSVLESIECDAKESVMIGDDVRDDVAGAMKIGIKGILVKTGKYRLNDENTISPPPDLVAESFKDAVDSILDGLQQKVSEID